MDVGCFGRLSSTVFHCTLSFRFLILQIGGSKEFFVTKVSGEQGWSRIKQLCQIWGASSVQQCLERGSCRSVQFRRRESRLKGSGGCVQFWLIMAIVVCVYIFFSRGVWSGLVSSFIFFRSVVKIHSLPSNLPVPSRLSPHSQVVVGVATEPLLAGRVFDCVQNLICRYRSDAHQWITEVRANLRNKMFPMLVPVY